MVASARAGPAPLQLKDLNGETIADAFRFLLDPDTVHAATLLSEGMQNEDGVKQAVKSFHRHLPAKRLACDLIPARSAMWTYKTCDRTFKISHDAAMALLKDRKVNEKKLKR